MVGLILGTGSNACYVERTERISALPQGQHGPEMIVNIEWGNFDGGSLLKTQFDRDIDDITPNTGQQAFEKQISGELAGNSHCCCWQPLRRKVSVPGCWCLLVAAERTRPGAVLLSLPVMPVLLAATAVDKMQTQWYRGNDGITVKAGQQVFEKQILSSCAENNHCCHQDSMPGCCRMVEAAKESNLSALMSLSSLPGHVSSDCCRSNADPGCLTAFSLMQGCRPPRSRSMVN